MFDKSLYKSKRLFLDEHFENGFEVKPLAFDDERTLKGVHWSFPETKSLPYWWLVPHYSKCCLVEDRLDTGNPYELTDTAGSKRIVYNPKEKSLLMQLDARKVYGGKSKVERYWPHLLIEQRDNWDYIAMPEGENKRFYSANCDKTVVEYDIRLLEYIPTTNPDDLDACQFVCYVYLQLLGGRFIYLGFNPFDNRGPIEFLWKKETGGENFIYSLTTEQVFGSVENSFNAGGKINVSEEWKHIEVDITPHLDSIIEQANRDLIFGRKVTRDEFYFSGMNMGYETHGNISCTFEVKNFNVVSYIKKD